MDSLSISDSTLWDTLRHDASLLGEPPKGAEVILSSPAVIRVLGISENSFSGGMAVVSYRVADAMTVYGFILLTHTDTNVAAVRMAFRAADVVAHVEHCDEFSSLALCVDVGGSLRYIVIGPLPSPVMQICCLRVLCSATTEKTKMSGSPSAFHLLKQRVSISLQPPRGLLESRVPVEITPVSLRESLLHALPAQYASLLALPPSDTLCKEVLHILQRPDVLEALLPPSLGGTVHMFTGPCGLRAAAWMGVASAMENNFRPAERDGFVAVLQEALVVLLVEEALHCCVVPWDKLYGYQELDSLGCSRELHVALIESAPLLLPNFAPISKVSLEPSYTWLSIKLPTNQERTALEDAMNHAHYAAMGHKMYVFKANEWSTMCLGVGRLYCAMFAVQELQSPMGFRVCRRKLHDPPKILLQTPRGSMSMRTHIALPPSADAEDVDMQSFAKLLCYHTPIVFLLFECVICPFDEELADLFISAFAELSPQQDCTTISPSLVLAALRAECMFRRLSPMSRGPLCRSAHRASAAIAFAACEEIVIRFLSQYVVALWDGSQAHVTGTGTHFEQDMLPCFLDALRALPHVPTAIPFVYDALHCVCDGDDDERLRLVAHMFLAALRRVACAAVDPSMECIDTTTTTGYVQVYNFLRDYLASDPRGNSSAWSACTASGKRTRPTESARSALHRMALLWTAHAAQALSVLLQLSHTHALFPAVSTRHESPAHAGAREAQAAQSEGSWMGPQHQLRNGESVAPAALPNKVQMQQGESIGDMRYTEFDSVSNGSLCARAAGGAKDVAVQTVRTAAQEEEQLRSHLRLHTQLRFFEEIIEQQKEERRVQQKQSKEKAHEDGLSAGVPFVYLKAYRAHLVRTEALERQVDELKQCCAAQQEEIRALQSENDAFVIAAAEAAAAPSLSKTLEVLGVELRRFLMAREEHERDKIAFVEVKERMTLMSMMLRFT